MGANTFESRVGGVTVSTNAHPLSLWFVLALRIVVGFAVATAGVEKLLVGFDASAALAGLIADGSPMAALLVVAAETPWVVAAADVVVPWGQLAVGLALVFGVLTRLAAFWGAAATAAASLATWGVTADVVTGNLIVLVVFLMLAAFGAGHIVGLDALIERYPVDGVPLVERYPVAGYLLG